MREHLGQWSIQISKESLWKYTCSISVHPSTSTL